MRRHWKKIALVVAAIIVCALFGVILMFDPQPSYQGRRLSEWIKAEDEQAELGALLHMDTNALPYLVKWTCYGAHARWQRTLLTFCSAHPSGLTTRLAVFLNWNYNRAEHAARALTLLSTNAYPALPQLGLLIAENRDPAAASRAQLCNLRILYGWPRHAVEMVAKEQRAFHDPNPAVRQAATNVHDLVTSLTVQ